MQQPSAPIASLQGRAKNYKWVHAATGACLILTMVSFGANIPVLGIIFGVLFLIGLPMSLVFGIRYIRRANAVVDEALRANAEAKARYLQQ